MQTIADRLGISKVTVHKTFSGQVGASYELSESIFRMADELGYIYKKHNYLNSKKFIFLAKRVFFLNDQEIFYSKIYQRMEEECANFNAKLILQFYEMEQDITAVHNLIYNDKSIAGIFTAGNFLHEYLVELEKLPLPIIMIDFFSPIFNFNYVYLYSYYDAYRLTHYAIKMGHRNIGYIGHTKGFSSLTDRYFGYRKALLEYRLPFIKEWHINENIDQKTEFSIELPKKLPTAFICHCDYTAKKLINALKLLKINVPEDLSILSFDDTDIADHTVPALTSMGIEKKQFARAAVRLMQHKLKEPNYSESIRLTPIIHERASVQKLHSLIANL